MLNLRQIRSYYTGGAHLCSALRPDSFRSTIVELLEAGSLCFVARHDGRAVGTCWVAPDHPYDAFLDLELLLSAGDAYLFDAYTLRRFAASASPRPFVRTSCAIAAMPGFAARCARPSPRTCRRCGPTPRAAFDRSASWGGSSSARGGDTSHMDSTGRPPGYCARVPS